MVHAAGRRAPARAGRGQGRAGRDVGEAGAAPARPSKGSTTAQ